MRWPDDRPCAAVLTHDIDVLHDRELFRILADCNHLRRMILRGERGHVGHCARRVVRNCFRPRRLGRDIAHLRDLERAHGFRSSFYFLIDRSRFNRNGGRYQIEEPAITQLIRGLVDEGCEVGVHGSYFEFDNVHYLGTARRRLEEVCGTRVVGIRNHQLQFSGLKTWRAQVEAGFEYDATWGLNESLGPLGGIPLPFAPAGGKSPLPILELPLTIMDTTLFRWMALDERGASEVVTEHVDWLARTGSLGVFLWHNNFFLEEEYADWEGVYRVLLAALDRAGAWVATGAEVAAWWRDHGDVEICREGLDSATRGDAWSFRHRNHGHDIRIPITDSAAVEMTAEDGGRSRIERDGADAFVSIGTQPSVRIVDAASQGGGTT